MVELTDREKHIIHIKFIMHGEEYAKIPVESRERLLEMITGLRDLDYNQHEMLDIGQAIIDEQEMIIKSGIGFLDKHKGSLKGLGGFFKSKGN
jgi:hypothetical protein